ncbi:MAG TPA: hypothetical protein VNW06_08970 [Cytophagaceae bacterium]|jgi:hypothetical protein|nr:hypothetical protein [Cytophagaceae bacterium]
MKKTILLTLIACATTIMSYAQDSTRNLIHCSKRNMEMDKTQRYFGFYGEMNYQYAQIRNPFTSISGGSFMVILDKRFAIGATMQKNSDQTFAPDFINRSGPIQFLHTGFGGLKMEYICMPNSIVHMSFPLVLGYGWANADGSEHIYSSNHYKDLAGTNSFFVIQPGAQVEVNLLSFLKLYAGVNYRFSGEADRTNTLPMNTLQGFGVLGGLKVGLFDAPVRKK